MKNSKLVYFFLLFSAQVSGQIVNNVSPDKSNIYIHALDSILKIVPIGKYQTISVVGSSSVPQNFPDKIGNVLINKYAKSSKKISKMKRSEIRFDIKDVEIIRDQFKVTIMSFGKDGIIEDGRYVFRYKYVPKTMSFELQEIKTGFLL